MHDEASSPLLARNQAFLTSETTERVLEEVRKSAREVYSGIKLPCFEASTTDPEFLRIIKRDAERTYAVPEKGNVDAKERSEARKGVFSDVLGKLCLVFGDYHQGLGYLCGFYSLFLDSEELLSLLYGLHETTLAGYFKAEPAKYVADIRVMNALYQKHNPSLSKHLSSLGVLPELFAGKWFIGSCVHVMDYKNLLRFHRAYFAGGFPYAVKFYAAFLDHFSATLLTKKSTSDILTILRVEDPKCDFRFPSSVTAKDMEEILDSAERFEELAPISTLEEMRAAQFRSVVSDLEAAKRKAADIKMAMMDDEIVFSDEEEENASDDGH